MAEYPGPYSVPLDHIEAPPTHLRLMVVAKHSSSPTIYYGSQLISRHEYESARIVVDAWLGDFLVQEVSHRLDLVAPALPPANDPGWTWKARGDWLDLN